MELFVHVGLNPVGVAYRHLGPQAQPVSGVVASVGLRKEGERRKEFVEVGDDFRKRNSVGPPLVFPDDEKLFGRRPVDLPKFLARSEELPDRTIHDALEELIPGIDTVDVVYLGEVFDLDEYRRDFRNVGKKREVILVLAEIRQSGKVVGAQLAVDALVGFAKMLVGFGKLPVVRNDAQQA